MSTATSQSIQARPGRVTITAVTPDRPGSGNAEVERSCGHNFHVAGVKPTYAVGDQDDCMTCYSDAWEAEHPGLPEEQLAAIEATLPKCPQCGGAIEKIPFIRRTVHKFYVEIDRQTGDILASSDHDDTLEEEPDWNRTTRHFDGKVHTGELQVECAAGHEWAETRLAYKYDWTLSEHRWTVRPMEAQS